MYLYDQVAQSTSETRARDAAGRLHRVPGPADFAGRLRDCGVRYVLDDTVRDTCLQLLCVRTDMICLADPCYRLPHETTWIEWTDPPPPGSAARPRRAGVIVCADDGGRSGTMTGICEGNDAAPWVAQVSFRFDFDREISGDDVLLGMPIESVRDPGEAMRLFRHCEISVDRSWLGYFAASGGILRSELEQLVIRSAPDFGMLCAFLLLISLECAAIVPREDLEKLNRARVRAGRPALLEHSDVRLRLAVASGARDGSGDASRSAPRLHPVRGHLVRRAGKTFWRTGHLRGDAARGVVATRTVHVSADRETLRSRLG